MITAFNANNYAQQWFFEKAFQTLLQIHPEALTEDEKRIGRFLSLDGYFAHMQDLILINPVFAIMPSDEEPFMIDANTRTVAIPASFSKCASVAGDDMCEIATFVVDRFYDYVDLATTNICVQWTTKTKKEGISHITLIDTDTIPGKIRFGWPLTGEMTEEPGSLTFAIRFFLKNESTQKLEYVLNTLPTALIVREGLQIDENGDKVIIESNNNLFASFIRNSSNPSYPEAKPVTWGAPGKDLEATAKINENNTFELKAQGIIADNGFITYTWYLKESEDDTFVKIDKNDKRFTISEKFEKINHNGKRTGAEHYYRIKEVSGGFADPANFSLVTTENFDEDEELYERFTILKVNDTNDQNITGQYYVSGTNYVGAEYTILGRDEDGNICTIPARNQSNESPSSICKVLSPAKVEYEDNLDANKFLSGDPKKVTLSIKTVKDFGEPKLTYTWYRSDKYLEKIDLKSFDSSKYEKVYFNTQEVNNSTYEAKERGWYFAITDSKLNRKVETEVTDVCRVINDPVAPKLSKMRYAKWTDDAFEDADEYFSRAEDAANTPWNLVDEDHLMGDSVVSAKGDVVRLQVIMGLGDNDTLDNITKLDTDEITYQWYVITPDSQTREIVESDADINNNGLVLSGCPVNKDYLDVRCQDNQIIYSYYCVVTNNLAGKSAVFTKEDYNNVLFQIW